MIVFFRKASPLTEGRRDADHRIKTPPDCFCGRPLRPVRRYAIDFCDEPSSRHVLENDSSHTCGKKRNLEGSVLTCFSLCLSAAATAWKSKSTACGRQYGAGSSRRALRQSCTPTSSTIPRISGAAHASARNHAHHAHHISCLTITRRRRAPVGCMPDTLFPNRPAHPRNA